MKTTLIDNGTALVAITEALTVALCAHKTCMMDVEARHAKEISRTRINVIRTILFIRATPEDHGAKPSVHDISHCAMTMSPKVADLPAECFALMHSWERSSTLLLPSDFGLSCFQVC